MEGFLILTGTVVAVIALLTGGGFIFNLLLNPIKKDIARIEAKLDQLLAKDS